MGTAETFSYPIGDNVGSKAFRESAGSWFGRCSYRIKCVCRKHSIGGGILIWGFRSKVDSFLTADHLQTFHKDGIVIVDSLLTETELSEITPELLSRMEKHVAEGVAVDDALINHHLTDPYIFNLTKHPNFLAAASQILDSPKLRIFSSRLLCKLPGTEEDPNSREVPWHQDSQYWPLEPMKEATLWLALDDVTEENGAMDMFTFSAVPESRGQSLPKIHLQEEVSTEFFI